ncbi:MAG: glycosyltransferase [Gammaproteobacteria bacterium]
MSQSANRPPRVAMVIDPWAYPFNGTVVSAQRFVGALDRRGFTFELLAIAGAWPETASRGTLFPKLSVPGFNSIIDRMRAPLARPVAARIEAALDGADLLHVQYPFFLGYAALQAARRRGLPVLCSFHVQPENILNNLGLTHPSWSRALYRLFVAAFYNRADAVIAPSRLGAGLLRAAGVTRPITVLSNGVPASFFAPHAPPVAADGRVRILSIGRLAREKQHDVVLQAVAASRHRHRIDLQIGGLGPQDANLRALAERLGVAVDIGWLGAEALADAYRKADVVLHAATAELEGMSVIEAMAAGNAVVVSDSPDSACAQFITDPKSRFRAGDPADLARRMDHWLDDAEARAASGAANSHWAASLQHECLAGQLADLYRRLAAERPRTETGDRT